MGHPWDELPATAAMTPVVELLAARKRYGAVEALRGVDLCIQPGEAVAPFGRMLLMQTWSRLLWFWRIPAWTVSSLAMPVFFFTFFGLRFAHLTDASGFSVGSYFLASFGAYAVGQVMVFSFGIGVSTERMLKQDLLMRATPLPPLVHLLARSLSAILFALVALVVLIAYGVIVGGIREDLDVWVTVVVRLLAGSLPFMGLGLA